MDIETTDLIRGEIRLWAVTQKQMAAALKLGTTRINELVADGIIVRDETARNGQVMLFESLRNYFLSRKTTDEGVNYWKEKGLNERAKRQLNEIKVRKADGELYEAKTVENAFIEMLMILRSGLLGLPSKMASVLQGKTRGEIYDILTAEIEGKLAAISEYNPNDYKCTADLTSVSE